MTCRFCEGSGGDCRDVPEARYEGAMYPRVLFGSETSNVEKFRREWEVARAAGLLPHGREHQTADDVIAEMRADKTYMCEGCGTSIGTRHHFGCPFEDIPGIPTGAIYEVPGL